jgi:hypothetical protein
LECGRVEDAVPSHFDLRYYDTNSDGEELFSDWAETRVAFSVSNGF